MYLTLPLGLCFGCKPFQLIWMFDVGKTVRGDRYSCACLFWCLDLYRFIREITWSHKVNATEHARKKTHTHTHTQLSFAEFWVSVLRKAVLEVHRRVFFRFCFHCNYTGSQCFPNLKEVQLLDMMLQRDMVKHCLFDCYKSLLNDCWRCWSVLCMYC